MRKKYLSALLFGALLLASAGTFTSCKDYDDDISNLQEQINTINTSLDELSDKINGLGAGVTDFKYENGKLIIVTDKGTNFEVTLPEADGIKELEIKDGVLYADGEAVGAVAGEGGAVSVEVKDGVLYINGEAQELNDEVGSKVVIVDNGDGTYTLTADGTSCVLPKASTSVGIIPTEQVYFTNLSHVLDAAGSIIGTNNQDADGGIIWGTADSYRGDWKGLKPVAKGQLLVGQISTVQVKVNAATYDLGTAKLTLVNTLGEEAPVTVTPVAEGKQGPAVDNGSRAADENGVWDLKIEMKSSVTADNIATAFAAKNADYTYKNVKYALAVDGKVATDYIYYIDTDETKAGSNEQFSFTANGGNATTSLRFKKDGVEKIVIGEVASGYTQVENIPIGTETTLYLTPEQVNFTNNKKYVDRIYDSYIEIKDADLAESLGVTAEGMTLNVSAKAAAKKDFPIVIHVLDIHGNESESVELKLNFAASTAVGQTLGDQKYTIMPSTDVNKQFVLVELGDIFTSLTADEAVAVSTDLSAGTGTVTWYTVQNTTDNKLFNVTAAPAVDGLKQISDNGKVLFYATKEDALANGLEYDEDVAIKLTAGTNADVDASTIRKIAYAVIPFSAIKNNALPDAMTPLTLVLKDKDENEIRKASGTYAITLPAFDDILAINKTQKLWNEAGDTYSTRFDWDATNNDKLKISMQKPFVSKTDANGTAYFDVNDADTKLYYELSYTDFDKKDQLVQVTNDDLTTLTGKIVKDGELMHEIEVEATLYPFGKANQENLKLTKTFKLYVQSVFEGAKLVYYVADAAQNVVTFGNDQYIEPGYKL